MTPLIEAQLEAFFREHRPPTRVADIGAGVDDRVAAALDRVEPPNSQYLASFPPHKGGSARLDRYDLDRLDICTGSTPSRYDTVVSCDLLEHVVDPFAAARNIIRSVRPSTQAGGFVPGGWLYVTTVFAFEHHEYPIDMWRFTTTALEHLFAGPTPAWRVEVERCWYEEETPHPDFGRRWRVSLVGQRP